MFKRTFLVFCIVGLTVGMSLVYGSLSSANGILAATGGDGVPVIATPTPRTWTYSDSGLWRNYSYIRLVREIMYSPTLSRNEVQALISLPLTLIALLVIQLLRTSVLGRFEIEAPLGQRLLRWGIMYGLVIVAAIFLPLGLWPLVIPVGWTALDLWRKGKASSNE